MKNKILFTCFIITAFTFSIFAATAIQKLEKNWLFSKGSHYLSSSNGRTIFVKHLNYYEPGASYNITVSPKQTYKLSFKVKGEPQANAYAVQIFLSDKKGVVGDKTPRLYSIPEAILANSYVEKSFIFTIPDNFKGKNVQVGLFGRVTGKGVIYDDLRIEKIAKPQKYELKITSPAYRQSIYQSKPVKEISGYVTAPESVKKVLVSFSKDGKIIKSLTGRKFIFPVTRKLAVGNYTIIAELFDKNNIKIKTFKSSIKQLPASKVEVVAGQDNNFYVNGKLFSPLFFSTVHYGKDSYKLRQYAASHGVNLFVVNASNYKLLKKKLVHAQKNNYKLLLVTTYYGSSEPEAVKKWIDKLSNILKPDILADSNLFGYFLIDEPAVKGEPLKPFLLAYKVLKNLDPYRPIWINAAPHGSVDLHNKYSQAADVYGMDVYPVGRWNHGAIGNVESLTCVGATVKLCSDAVKKQKPIWEYLQAYAWKSDWNTPSKAVYPDIKQSRFMFYDTVFNGATGFGYFGVNTICRESFVDILFNMTSEIHKMSRLIAQGQIVNNQNYGTVHTRTFKYGNDYYLIAANYSDSSCTVELEFTEGNASVPVLFENRRASVKNKKIRDNFSAFDVHIYAKNPLPKPFYKTVPYKGSGNPWLERIRAQKKIRNTKSKANWIWAESEIKTANSKVWLAREILIRSKVSKATLIVTADNKANIFIDGKKIATTRSWNRAIKKDVTSYLTSGEHLMTAYAQDLGGLPCGFLAHLRIKYDDGTEQNIYSDNSWYSMKAESLVVPEKLDIKTSWSRAKIIAPYGKGRWGSRVIFPKQ